MRMPDFRRRKPVWIARGVLFVVVAMAVVSDLTGCVNYAGIHDDRQIAGPAQYPATHSLPDEHGQWPTLAWADQFGDPQLPALIGEALRGSPTIDAAQARIAKANAYVGEADAARYPSVSGSYAWTRARFSDNSLVPPPYRGSWQTLNNAFAHASWDLDLWGKQREGFRQAVSDEKATEAEADAVRIALAASVASAYNQLARLYALHDIQAREAGNRQDIGSVTERRVRAGLDTDVERQTAHGETSTTLSTVSGLDGQIMAVRYQLAALLGAGPDRGDRIARPTFAGLDTGTPAMMLPDNLPADLVSRRPDIVAAYWQVDAALHGVKVTKAEFYPDINLSVDAGLSAVGWGRFLTTSSRQVIAGPAIHLPIFDAGALRAQLKGDYADFDGAVAHYDRTLIDALSDVASQVARIRAADKQLVDARQALDAQTTAYRLALIRYRAGLIEQLTLLRADDNRLAAEVAVVNLEMDRRDMQIALIHALGGGFDNATAHTDTQAPRSAP
ncbi:NodT family efflux transporter outer membrane factor (OMF) lipoprotein [Cupriavidus plantarum]|nr:NodT family efflux transporter outer membrane factor (OMF) lipoprotein [Cupriavidus plantarum]